jgi:hypothetical protein
LKTGNGFKLRPKSSKNSPGLDDNKISSVKQLDVVFSQAHDADIRQRWVEANEITWYPYVQEPDEHFKNAHDAFLIWDFKKTAEEIRKGAAFVKLEDVRATGDAQRSLVASTRELAKLADEASLGEVKDVKSLDKAFARADYALALTHRAETSEGWASRPVEEIPHKCSGSEQKRTDRCIRECDAPPSVWE